MTKSNDRNGAPLGLSVLLWAFYFSAAGLIGGIYFLKTLLSIPVTVPIGALIGALWGVINWAVGSAEPDVRHVFKWVIGIWIVTLLYVHFIFTRGFGPWVVASGVWLQVVLLVGTAFLLLNDKVRTRLTSTNRRCSAILLTTLVLLIVITLFPPVMRPWWVPEHEQSAAALPSFAFFFDPGFAIDKSHYYPRYAVNGRVLLLEWIAVIAFASAACWLVTLTQKGRLKKGEVPFN